MVGPGTGDCVQSRVDTGGSDHFDLVVWGKVRDGRYFPSSSVFDLVSWKCLVHALTFLLPMDERRFF